MITAQDIREKGFETAKINGYAKAEVDDFLEEIAAEVTNMQKENAVLKSKMKVLVDKIEEYRSNEEALNLALLSAQKLAVQIESEARTRAAAMISDADKQVTAKIGSISELADAEEQRLANAKAANQKFFDAMRTMCNAQLSKLDTLSTSYGAPAPAAEPAVVKPQAPAASVDATVRSIENSVSKIKPEPEFKIDLSSAIESVNGSKNSFDSTQPFTF